MLELHQGILALKESFAKGIWAKGLCMFPVV